MEEDGGGINFYPPIRGFEDTGWVEHSFSDGSTIMAKVVPSNDSAGYAINLVIHDGDRCCVCDFTMDRFSALCIIDVLVKNLTAQEELNGNNG